MKWRQHESHSLTHTGQKVEPNEWAKGSQGSQDPRSQGAGQRGVIDTRTKDKGQERAKKK